MTDFGESFKKKILSSRVTALTAVMILFSGVLIARLFVLQIVRGEDYQSNYDLLVEKTENIEATRGSIYDRNGKLLAYNELAFAVTIEDSGTYNEDESKNEVLSRVLYEVLTHLKKNGDEIDNDFGIYIDSSGKYQFADTGTALQRFRADIFGHAKISQLEYNTRLNLNEAKASADEIMTYLTDKRFEIPEDYPKEIRYQIAVIRYNMNKNYYQKYIGTTIASNVSEKTVAYVKENQNELVGVDIEEKSIRKYNDSEAFSSVIGYTGTISTDEYNELSKDDDTYTLTDAVGKAGIEQYMNQYLRGTKGQQTVYVDSVGNLIETTDRTDPISGGDVYLSIDANLQKSTYSLLEKEIAGILLQKIVNTKTKGKAAKASEIVIPIYDVYYALIGNGLIDIRHFNEPDASDLEKSVNSVFEQKRDEVIANLRAQLLAEQPTNYSDLPEEYQEYTTYIVRNLKDNNVILRDAIDPDDEMQEKWTSESASAKEYLTYCIEKDWTDITVFTGQSQYVDTEELYDNLVSYIIDHYSEDNGFDRLIYKNAILEDRISGNQLCAILYDQGVLKKDDETRNALAEGRKSAYEFMRDCISTLTITPGQLALEPCSGSSVIIDTKTGELLACVTYPGFDSNRLSNAKDSSYYSSLNTNLANPLYNNATQQRTAPGSTFKMCSSMAGLSEQVITTETQIVDVGEFDKVSNHPKCWIYPSAHGSLNVSEAIRHSCNYFFYEVGFRLAGGGGYNDARGIKRLQKYAALLGLDSKTGVEIEENTSKIATEYPVMAAIGQSNNNITTIALARYVTAIASSGTVYDLSLLDHVEDGDGKVLEKYGSTVKTSIGILNAGQWDAIHSGMRMVAEDLTSFNGFSVAVAGKTGTAEINNHPNHALFVGYAPYENPRIALATRIAYGYTSHNAADISRYIFGIYFDDEASKAFAKSDEVQSVSTSGSVTD